MKKALKGTLALVAASALAASGFGQITIVDSDAGAGQINLGATYSQNFDTLSSSGTTTWTDNSTLSGWYTNRTSLIAGTGSGTSGALYSYGTSSDRALGSLASGSTGTIYYGAQFVNSVGNNIDQVMISYDGEQWRRGANATQRAESLTFSYQIFNAGAGSLTAATGWTSVNLLEFVTPNATDATASALDGNLSGNRNSSIAASITGLSFQNTQELWIRWADADYSGTDHGIAIDNVSLTAIPEPSTYAAIMGLVTMGVVLYRRRSKKA